jgi:hypothetical protein
MTVLVVGVVVVVTDVVVVVVVVVLPHPLSTIQSESTIAPMIHRTLFEDFLIVYTPVHFYAYAIKRYHHSCITVF